MKLHLSVRTLFVLIMILMSLRAAAQLKYYAGAGVGVAQTRLQCPGGNCNQTAPGFKIFAGLNLNELVTAEISYIDFGKATGNGVLPGGALYDATVHTRTVGISVGHPFTVIPRFSITPSLGAGVSAASLKYENYSDANSNKANVRYLAGVSFNYLFSPAIDFRLQADFTQSKVYTRSGNAMLFGVVAAFKYHE